MSSEGQGPDLGALLSQIGQMQAQLQAAQEQAASQVVEGSSGGGAVRIVGTGGLDVSAVIIDPAVVDPADVEMLSDLVLAAVRDLIEQARGLQQQSLGGLGGPGGLGGLGGIEGLLGG